MNESLHNTSSTHSQAPAKQFTIGLLTTGDFARFAPDHWLSVIDAARQQHANVICFMGEAIHMPQGYYDPFLPAAEVGTTIGAPGGVHGPAGTIFDLADSDTLDGLIIWSSTLTWFIDREQLDAFCRRYHCPIISVEVPLDGIPSVLIDDYGGMYSVVSHLIEVHHCRRIAFLRGFETHYGMHERYRGYVAALADHGLAIDPDLVVPGITSDGKTELRVLLDDRGLEPKRDFDAVIGWSGGAVAGIHALFEERAIRTPDDVAVAGFDNPAELSIYDPPYTMVDPQVSAIGRRAVELMLAMLRGERVPERTTIPARLVARRSCGCSDPAVVMNETMRREQVYQALRKEQRSQMLREVESALINTYDLHELADTLTRSLPSIGIPSALLALYEQQPDMPQGISPEWSQLILSYTEQSSLFFEAGGQRFRSRLLAPEGLLLHERPYSCVIEPLYFRERSLGFAVFGIGPHDSLAYEVLREGISHALYGDWMLRQRRRTEDALRRHAIELELHQREQARRSMLEQVIRAGKAMSQAADLRTCLLTIRNTVQQELDFDRIGVFLYDPDQHAITGTFGTDRDGHLTEEWGVAIPIFDDAPHRVLVFEPDRFVFTPDYQAAYNPPPDNIMAGVKEHALVGVWVDDRPAAIIAVDNLLSRRTMTEVQLEGLRLIAGYAALAIKNARLLDQARQAEQKYRAIFDNSLDGIAQITLDGQFLSANAAMARILGYTTPEELLAGGIDVRQRLITDPARFATLKQLLEEQGMVHHFEYQIRRQDGQLAWLSLDARLLHTTRHTYIEGICQDITERRQLEAQLLKAQKMEAIGQMAGGIAHDFNNLLVVIAGSADLISSMVQADNPIQTDAREILRATERAANLTRQLLTFARRQATTLQILDLNTLIQDLDKLLRRLIREHIQLQTKPFPDLWSVQADPGQIEQVLINLVINARDAMPHGGRLTIECANVTLDERYVRTRPTIQPGQYAMLVVSDTGTGMTEEVLQHAFEPFFTTKEPGQGTGLGLATCYGIIKQHNGSIELYSEIGQGTSVKIYLPRATEAGVSQAIWQENEPLVRGKETILLVEDEPSVRTLTARILAEQGYTVLEASNGLEAIDIVQQRADAPIDLLITDVVMPKLGGYELARQLHEQIPGLRVLFMSGYPTGAVVHNGFLEASVTFIQKPFTRASLTRSVRTLLDR